MKAIPIPFNIKVNRGYFHDEPEVNEPDAGYVFFLIDPIWGSNMDDKYHYRYVMRHIYKRFTNKYYDELDRACRSRCEWAGEPYGVFKTYENQIKFYRDKQPKFYWN